MTDMTITRNTPDTITINGVDYVEKAQALDGSPAKIVVLQRGWVVIGRVTQTEDQVLIQSASVIRYWGTTKGLGELREGPTSKTILDPCGDVEAHPLTVVLTMDVVAEKWGL